MIPNFNLQCSISRYGTHTRYVSCIKRKYLWGWEGIYFIVKFINRILFYLKIKSAYQWGCKAPIYPLGKPWSLLELQIRHSWICNLAENRVKSCCVVLPLKWGSIHHKVKASNCWSMFSLSMHVMNLESTLLVIKI